MTIIGAIAPVTWTNGDNNEEVVMFIIGDTPQEIDDHDNAIYQQFQNEERTHIDQRWLRTITVLEVTRKQWWDIKHGTNINLGYYINDTKDIELLKEPA